MGAAGIDKKINEYLLRLNHKQKQTVLTVVKTFANDEDLWWEDIEKAAAPSIKKGLKQAEKGNETAHTDVMKKYNKWLSK